MKRLFVVVLAFAALASLPLWADDTGDDFFNDATAEAPADNGKQAAKPDEAIDKESLSLSGNIQAIGTYNFTRDFLWGYTNMDDNVLSYLLTGDFLLDARLRKGFRAFLDLNVEYSNAGLPVPQTFNLVNPVVAPVYLQPAYTTPSGDVAILPSGSILILSESQNLLIDVKELFIDFNIANAVYFRLGKQVLQWGTGFFWNPTDMINIEKKNFLNMTELRQGNFGLRTDFAFAPVFHVFTYVEFEGAQAFSQMAVAGKAEFLLGPVETSLSAWWKGGKVPVFGWDISAPLFWDIDFHAEAAVSWGDNLNKMDSAGNPYQIRDQLVARVSAGFSKSFTVNNDDNGVVLNAEFYYNSSGYDQNMFDELSPTNLAIFLEQGYYDANDYGKYYGLLSVSIDKFLANQLVFTIAGLGNFSDMSFVAYLDFAYTPVYDFTIDFKILSYLGLNNREYTMAPTINGASVTLKNNLIGATLSCDVKF